MSKKKKKPVQYVFPTDTAHQVNNLCQHMWYDDKVNPIHCMRCKVYAMGERYYESF
jgi:hypothetical protein